MTLVRQIVRMADMSTAAQEHIPEISLGWRLKIALSYANIKAEDIATELDVSRQTVTRWMTGNGAPPKRVFVKEWARLTGVSLAWLETGQAPHGPTSPGTPTAKPDKLASLTEAKRRRVQRGSSPTIGVGVLAA